MLNTYKIIIIILAILAICKIVELLSNRLADNLNLSRKLVAYSSAFIIFVICSYLWNYTGFYEYISAKTGIPLDK
jgi:hypothetical protein